MAQYTMTILEILQDNNNIFDFDYNFYKSELKEQFQDKFLNTFMFDEIGVETYSRFKHNLKTMLNEIYPYYDHLYKTTTYEYNPILNYDVNEEITRDVLSDEDIVSGGSNNTSNYDTPIVKNNNYKDSPSFIVDDINSNNSNRVGNIKETNKRSTKGNIGVMTTQDLIQKERQVIINIDKMILEELKILFMGVYE